MAKYLFFKPSGKYYSEGEGANLPINGMDYTRQQIMALNGGKMPGLSTQGSNFFLVIVDDEMSFPRLYHPETGE